MQTLKTLNANFIKNLFGQKKKERKEKERKEKQGEGWRRKEKAGEGRRRKDRE